MTSVAILGGGQLGRMLALAAHRLGVAVQVVDPDPLAPAGAVAPLVTASFGDAAAVAGLVAGCDAVTFEVETVPVALLRGLEQRGLRVLPGSRSLAVAQDRLAEKQLFAGLGIATPRWAAVADAADIPEAVAQVGLPALLKRRRGGYDGRGQRFVASLDEARAAVVELGGGPFLLEQAVSFRRELSVNVVRSRDGDIVVYPLGENVHQGGVLAVTRAPAAADPWLVASAHRHAVEVADALGHVGSLTLELFDDNGLLLANEIAPRVHNTGHWTIEGAQTSQFENHLRAVLGLPLGSTAARGATVLVNLLGTPPPIARLLAVEGASVHLYGKEPRPGRKVGHVTLVDSDHDRARLDSGLFRILSLIERSTDALPHHALR